MTDGARRAADRFVRVLLVACIAAGTWLVLRPVTSSGSELHFIGAASRHLAAHRYDRALTAALRALEVSPESPSALLLAGYGAAGTADLELSDSLLRRIPADSRQTIQADLGLAKNLLSRGKVVSAEQLYRRVLRSDPQNVEANRRLSHLLQAEGRTYESVEFLTRLLYQGELGGNVLFMIASPDRYFRNDPRLQDTLNADDAGDPLIRLGEVRLNLIESNEANVRSALEELVRGYPQLAEPRARLGRQIVDNGSRAEFLQWNDEVTAEHEQHPEIWYVRGLFARRDGQVEAAVRCFLETLTRAPHHTGANYQISGCLLQLGQAELAGRFSELLPVLVRLDEELNFVQGTPTSENARRVVGTLQQLGRHWEAAGWAHIARPLPGAEDWTTAVMRTEVKMLSESDGLVARDAQPALSLTIAEYPLPEWPSSPDAFRRDETHLRQTSLSHGDWRFSEEALSAGINFQYDDGTTRRDRMRHVIETLGGGAGVIDFDADGWPDLYIAQGNSWRQRDAGSAPLDRLFRNSADGRFIDVTALSGIHEPEMSHGVSVGDYDSDGLADVYVTNLYSNTMFHNNGDGTFSETTTVTGTAGDEWSASSAIADLSGDGLPDLFVVNYLDRDFVIRNPCHSNGMEVGCTPASLLPARNRLYRNSGDGRFEDISHSSGVGSATGNGLGLIVADFHNERRLSVFVGNDSTPNFLFRNVQSSDTTPFWLDQQGFAAGVAYNGNGSPIASMGIAAGDANGDGRLDLFVTTYMNDPDTLFVQQADGLFVDATRQARLQLPTASVLGFGSQFLDVDNNGWEDLVATNGHVIPAPPDEPDDERDLMPTQVIANVGDGTFQQVPAESLGPFFQFRGLGRGLAEVDWNRDGRQDFCVSYIHSPFALLSNQTPVQCHRLVIRLIGTESSRDAFGTIATVRTEDRQQTRQLTAGSGYLVSNERRLWFGLGQSSTIDELTVTWPAGRIQRFSNLSADREILILEGRDTPVTLRQFQAP